MEIRYNNNSIVKEYIKKNPSFVNSIDEVILISLDILLCIGHVKEIILKW